MKEEAAAVVVVAGSDWRSFQQQTEMALKETNVGEPKHRVKGKVLLHSGGLMGDSSAF